MDPIHLAALCQVTEALAEAGSATAVADYEQCLALARRVGQASFEPVLTRLLAQHLAAQGELAGACQRLTAWLETPGNGTQEIEGAVLALDLADYLRARGMLADSDAWFERASDALGHWPAEDSTAERFHCHVLRVQLRIDQGLPDRAAAELAAAEKLAAVLDDDLARLRLEAARNEVLLASEGLAEVAERTRRQLEAPVADEALRGILLGQRAYALAEQAYDDKARVADARTALADALDHPRLQATERVLCHVRGAWLDLEGRDWSAARANLSAARSRLNDIEPGGTHPPSVRAHLALAESRLALSDPGTDAAQRSAARAAVESALEDLIEAWAKVPLRNNGVGVLYLSTARQMLVEYAGQVLKAEGPERAAERLFEVLARVEAQGTLARRLDGGVPEWRTYARDVLGPTGGLLACLPGRSVVAVVCITAPESRLEIRGVPSKHWDDVRRWRDSIGRPPDEAWDAGDEGREAMAARTLAARMLSPEIERMLAGCRALAIHGADLCENLPFEALVLSDGSRLGLEWGSFHPPSIPAAWALQRRRSTAPVPSIAQLETCAELAGALKACWPMLSNLPVDRADLRKLHWAFGADSGAVDMRLDSSLAQLLDRAQEPAYLLQIVAHGAFDGGRELSRGIVMPGGRSSPCAVWPEDLELEIGSGRHWPPIVVLSVCGSAAGYARVGDAAAASLAAPFLIGGAGAVVASAVDVALEAELRLTGRMNAELAQGKDLVEALRLARADLAAQARFAHPFYWAWPHVIGLADPARWTPPLARAIPPLGSRQDGSSLLWTWLAAGAGLATGAGVVAAVVLVLRLRRR